MAQNKEPVVVGFPPPMRHIFAAPFDGGPWQHWGTYDPLQCVAEEFADIRMSEMVPASVFSTADAKTILAVLNRTIIAEVLPLTGVMRVEDMAVGRHARRTRKCLVCRSSFESRSSAERVCRRCKMTSFWKDGVATGPDAGIVRPR